LVDESNREINAMSLTTKILNPTPYDQLLALPENLVGEVIGGQLYTQPRPTGKHAIATRVATRGLSIDIGGPFDFF
jgi:hypothetical protein